MKRTAFRVALGLAVLIAAHGAQATQSVFPAANVTGSTFTPAGTNSWGVSRAGGQQLVFFGRYTSDNPNEAGLGLKIQYDSAKITGVAIDQVLTKCMVFAPDVQALGASSQVLFGWADTSQRPNGAVGWPSQVDGAIPCINPQGIVTTTAAFPAPTTLFRLTATTAAGFTSGTSTITLSPSSASSAGGVSSYTNTTLVVTGLAAAPCNLDVDGNGTAQTFVDGILIVRHMLGLTGSSLTSGLTIPGPNYTAAQLDPILAANNYDIDGSGTQQTFVDGIILVRLMLGISDANLLNGITLPLSATFTNAATIRANVNAKCGTSF